MGFSGKKLRNWRATCLVSRADPSCILMLILTPHAYTMVCFPLLARPLIARRGMALFTILLAISPSLIFYSRVARPYRTAESEHFHL